MTQASAIGIYFAVSVAAAVGVAVAAYNGAFDDLKPAIQGLLSLPQNDDPAKQKQPGINEPAQAAKPGDIPPPPIGGFVTRDTPPINKAPLAHAPADGSPAGTGGMGEVIAALPAAEGQTAEQAVSAMSPSGRQLPETAITGDSVRPSFDIVRVESTGDAVIAGRAAPNAPVKLMAAGRVIAETVASANGEWVVVLDRPLPKGASDLSIVSMASDGVTEIESEQRVAVAVPDNPSGEVLVVLQKPGEASTILAAPGGQGGAAEESQVAARQPDDPSPDQQREISLSGMAGTPGQPSVGIRTVEAEGGKLFVGGTADPGALVRIYVDNGFLGEAKADSKGEWRLSVRAITEAGDHRIRVDSIAGEEGTVVARAEVPYAQEDNSIVLGQTDVYASGEAQVAALGEASGTTNVARFEINRGDNLWRIARRLYGQGLRYTTIFEANRNQIRNPDLIYPGQVFLIPKGGGEMVAE